MRMPHVSSASAVMATIIAIKLEVEERGTIVLLKEKMMSMMTWMA
jgi:hypothetical protein